MADQSDGNLASKGKKGKLTNSQLRLLGFVAACGPDGCSETKQALARKLQISLKTVIVRYIACAKRGLSRRMLVSG